jgi:hypothetical protein
MKRFNILVLNYKRLHSFFNNFDKIRAFDPLQDKITILSCSPDTKERQQVEAFAEKYQLPVTYLTRQNFGIDQCARVEYFSGQIEDLREILNTEYIFQFQDHYLDTDASYSKWEPDNKWGPELNGSIKGDVVPENVIFDLNSLNEILRSNKIAAAFCDRNTPCWFQRNGRTHIAPNGGNYVLHTKQLEDKNVQTELARMYRRCDNTYRWAIYAEFKWGELFFNEGNTYYDIKRDKVYAKFSKEKFYVSPDPVSELYDYYEGNVLSRILGSYDQQLWRNAKAAWASICLSLFNTLP